ncbi:DUF2971 domain-containing protein [uncultured Acetobacteroides sp.]|uniref:DUF2971 domain-containing protein n=1 Tax=uncultured Acetobacteroides sp. TaxID=1760811 RepID=UPI0029F513B3|nr:DUF2971 domain-containing protein [uncultured Acetobacteroides sp.]
MNNEFNPDDHPHVWHYTSINSLVNGLIEEDGNLCFWASHRQYLNDPMETILGVDLRDRLINEKSLKIKYGKATPDIFIVSFSLSPDILPMWNMYGGNGNGIMLKLDSKLLNVKEYSMYHMEYDTIEVINQIENKLDDNLNSTFTEGCPEDTCSRESAVVLGEILITANLPEKIKSNSYQYENEVRISHTTDIQHSLKDIKYRCSNGVIIPYMEFRFLKEALKEITIGPTNDFERSKFSLKMFLDSKELGDVKISKSEVPYRG